LMKPFYLRRKHKATEDEGFQRLRSSSPTPPPVTVQVGEPGHNSHEVVHHDGQAQGDPHDDVHEEVSMLLVLLLFNQA